MSFISQVRLILIGFSDLMMGAKLYSIHDPRSMTLDIFRMVWYLKTRKAVPLDAIIAVGRCRFVRAFRSIAVDQGGLLELGRKRMTGL